MKKSPRPRVDPAPAAAQAPRTRAILWNVCAWRPDWLATQLATLARRSALSTNPLGPDGELHALARGWTGGAKARREEELQSAIEAFDFISMPIGEAALEALHFALMPIASRAGFRHVLLYQRRGLDRLSALAHGATQAESAAPRALLRRERSLTLNGARVRRGLQNALHQLRLVALEDLLGEDVAAESAWTDLIAALAAPLAPGAAPAALRKCRVRLRREHAALYELPLPLRSELAREAAFLPGVETPPGFLQGVVRAHEAPSGPARVAQFNLGGRPMIEGDAVQVAGMVLAAAPGAGQTLVCVQDGQRQALAWGQASPALAAKFPEIPAAAQARVKPFIIRSLERELTQVRLCEAAAERPVADISFQPAGRPSVPGILLAQWSIGYQPIPKVACTSLKEALFQAATGAPFGERSGLNIHDFFYRRPTDIAGAAFKFLLVRDPIKRFLSAFGNRVIHFKELGREYLSRLPGAVGLDLAQFPFDPTLDEFIERFELYRRVPSIDHHCRPIAEFVSPLSAFDKIYGFEQIDEMCADLSRLIGAPLVLPHSQRGGPKLKSSMLSERSLKRLLEIYAADYRLLDGLYGRPSLAALKADRA